MAWPDSWNATIRRSLSLMTRFFSSPAMTRSIASSKSFMSTAVLSRRAASSAASLTRLARSAPAKPAVRAAIDLEVDALADLHVLDVNPQDVLAAADVGLVDEHLPIEAARAEQGRIEHLGAVGRAHDDDALAAVEAVHLGEQLVERLLALLVAAHRRLDADLAERVELVDEDDARAPCLRPG